MRIDRARRRHSSTPTRPSARGDETKETKEEEESWPLDVVALRAVRVRARAWMDGWMDDASIRLHLFVRSFVRVDFGRLTRARIAFVRSNSAHWNGAGGAAVREIRVFRQRGMSLREPVRRSSRGGHHLHARAIVGRERGDEDEG